MDDGRALLGEGGGQRLAEPVGLHGDDRDAEGLDQRAEVGLDQVDVGRLAELVALVLAQDPVAAVVDEQELRVERVLARGRELGDARS